MGLSLGSVLSAATGGLWVPQVDIAGDALGVQNPRTTAVVAGISSIFGPEAGAIASAFGSSFINNEAPVYNENGEVVSGNGGGDGGVMPTMGAVPVIAATLGNAVLKLARVFGISAAASRTPLAYARRIWTALTGWASRNPGVSLLSMLVSLGLTAEEAAHFLAWGATQKKRRRRGGITASQLRTTRRTMRTITRMYHSLPKSSSRGAGRFGRGGGATIVQAR